MPVAEPTPVADEQPAGHLTAARPDEVAGDAQGGERHDVRAVRTPVRMVKPRPVWERDSHHL